VDTGQHYGIDRRFERYSNCAFRVIQWRRRVTESGWITGNGVGKARRAEARAIFLGGKGRGSECLSHQLGGLGSAVSSPLVSAASQFCCILGVEDGFSCCILGVHFEGEQQPLAAGIEE